MMKTIMRSCDNLTPDSLALDNLARGQFGTKIIWHQDILVLSVKIDNFVQKRQLILDLEKLGLVNYYASNVMFC